MGGKLATTKKRKPMEVLWGAWARYVNLSENNTDVMGIYNVIWKRKRSDFPFTVDLRGMIVYQASLAESNKTFQRTLAIVDIDGTLIYSEESPINITSIGDAPYRWYEEYEFRNVEIIDPGFYQLSILINGEEKQVIPLWVVAPKKITTNLEDDSSFEEWDEQ